MSNISISAAPAAGEDFRIGAVFSRAWEIGLRNFGKFVVVTAIVGVPDLIMSLLSLGARPAPHQLGPVSHAPFAIVAILMLILRMVLGVMSEAVLLYGAFQYMRDRAFDLGEAIQKGLTRFFPILGVALLSFFGIALALSLLIVPGIILAVRWSVAVPACVVEGLGPIASMRRSFALTRGYSWKVFAILLLLVIITVIGMIIFSMLSAFFLVFLGPFGATLALFAWTAIIGVFSYCVLIMIYHDLRAAKEGVAVEELAAVFD
jgi:uncharacterized membrane protein YidH (DUF202 family)